MPRSGRPKQEDASPAKTTGVQKKKAPPKPYIAFAIKHREEAKERLGNRKTNLGYAIKKTKPGDISKMLGQMWHEMSDAEKKPYEDKYQVDYAKYLAEMEE
jgi:hypothetical protein